MWIFRAPSADRLYRELVDACYANGQPAWPRGLECRELRPAFYQVNDPRRALYAGRSRRLNYRFFAVEFAAYVAGWGDQRHADLLCAVNSNMRRFVNPDTGTFDGAYGPRLARSFGDIVALLRRDPHSRQAVASVWSPGIPTNSLDVPCTLTLQFFQNEVAGQRQLDLLVNMRSQDLNWGWPYDVGAFAALQCAVANVLGWDVGRYLHTCGSLHLYAQAPPNVVANKDEVFHAGLELPRHPYEEWGKLEHLCNNWLSRVHYFVFSQPPKPDWPQFDAGTFEDVEYFNWLGDLVRGKFQGRRGSEPR